MSRRFGRGEEGYDGLRGLYYSMLEDAMFLIAQGRPPLVDPDKHIHGKRKRMMVDLVGYWAAIVWVFNTEEGIESAISFEDCVDAISRPLGKGEDGATISAEGIRRELTARGLNPLYVAPKKSSELGNGCSRARSGDTRNKVRTARVVRNLIRRGGERASKRQKQAASA